MHCCGTGVPYDLTPQFLDELLTKHRIDYVIHGDDPCIMPGAPSALHRDGLPHQPTHPPDIPRPVVHVSCACATRGEAAMHVTSKHIGGPPGDGTWEELMQNSEHPYKRRFH